MDRLNKTRSLFYKVHEAKKALIKDIDPVNSSFDSPGQRLVIQLLCLSGPEPTKHITTRSGFPNLVFFALGTTLVNLFVILTECTISAD